MSTCKHLLLQHCELTYDFKIGHFSFLYDATLFFSWWLTLTIKEPGKDSWKRPIFCLFAIWCTADAKLKLPTTQTFQQNRWKQFRCRKRAQRPRQKHLETQKSGEHKRNNITLILILCLPHKNGESFVASWPLCWQKQGSNTTLVGITEDYKE